ncbi:triggering receptor expressed on myeloid cells 1-like isoform X2 [Loxodonta africana]|uniref:triggering receptor expressed on myeloid cells 1-like isoform X2 n=1 Tax=Loxodonta africana TaxID=9785 RepID=UPI0030CFE187
MASRQRVQKLDRMGRTGLWRWPWLLLLLLYVSEFQAVTIMEEKVCLIEGNNLTEICPYNIMKYASSLKAWQRDPVILHDRIRLVHCDDPSGTAGLDKNSIQTLKETTTLALTTTTTLRTPLPKLRTMTQPLPTSTAIVSSKGLKVNFTNVGDVTRVSVFSIIVPVLCGILSKSLVFTVLLFVTQRSAAS